MTRALLTLVGAVLFVMIISYAATFIPSAQFAKMPPSSLLVHRYNDENVSLKKIRVRLVFAVPKDKKIPTEEEWKKLLSRLDEAMREITAFHKIQMYERSQIRFDVYPDPVALLGPSVEYDTQDTSAGNPRALMAVTREIDARVISEKGDLYRKDFAPPEADEYSVLAVAYQGVGASGGIIVDAPETDPLAFSKRLGIAQENVFATDVASAQGIALFNIRYVEDQAFAPAGTALVYHELAHAFGFPNFYDAKTGDSWTEGIMGAGRNEPLSANFIETQILEGVGLLARSNKAK